MMGDLMPWGSKLTFISRVSGARDGGEGKGRRGGVGKGGRRRRGRRKREGWTSCGKESREKKDL